jgi:hypothetical protein
MATTFLRAYTKKDIRIITKSTTIYGESEKMTAISFKNIGTVPANIGGFPLNPGDEMLSFDTEIPHYDSTEYPVIFDNVAGSKKVAVVLTKVLRVLEVETSGTCKVETKTKK